MMVLSEPRGAVRGITELLSADHERLKQLLEHVRSAVRCVAWANARGLFRTFAADFRRHMRLEETLVFPLFAVRVKIVGPIRVMNDEHRRLEALIEMLVGLLDREEGAAFTGAFDELTNLIAVHNIKEERIVFPKTDDLLSDTERSALRERLNNEM